MRRFIGKTALVTGAVSGIGLAVSRRLVAEGAFVLLADIDRAAGEAAARALGESALYLPLDVRREEAWAAAAARLVAEDRELDVLINSAGITGFADGHIPQDPERIDLAALRGVLATNLEGIVLGCRFAIAALKERDAARRGAGAIVNLASRSGLVGMPLAAAYGASKAAVANYTKSVALYCAGRGYPIRCNALSPAAIDTPMWDPLLGTGPERAANMRLHIDDCPLGRFGTPDEAAAAVAFLASDDASYLTGADVPLDGGTLAGAAALPSE